jgi:hypothetical protein
MEIHESIRRLGEAFGLNERRVGAYVGELAGAGVDAEKLEEAVGFSIRNFDRCPTIADLIRRCRGDAREGTEQLSEQETRDLIIRRLRLIYPNKKVTDRRIAAHWAQFEDEFRGRLARRQPETAFSGKIFPRYDMDAGQAIFRLAKAKIVWDHKRGRFTECGENPIPLTRQELDAMRYDGWRPPMPSDQAILERWKIECARAAATEETKIDQSEEFELPEVPF